MKGGSVGIFDSGVGGLSVWKELIKLLPAEKFLYFSDSAFCPYGPKGQEEITKRAFKITDFFLGRGVKLIVVACNTATAASIEALREKYDIPFIGMEPAVKPAALHSRSGVIGVLATQGTFRGKLYNRTLERFASDIKVIERVGEGLVEMVESGERNSSHTEKLLRRYIEPMVAEKADHIVLGCTHYPFLEDLIKKIAGPEVSIVNPAPAVALHTQHILSERGLLRDADEQTESNIVNNTIFYSSGEYSVLKGLASSILEGIPEENFNNQTI